MRLHAYYRSSTSYRVRIGLNLKALDYEIVPVNLLQGEQRGDAYRAINAFAGVPLLEYEGRFYAQSIAILEWLDDRFPDSPLLPDGREDRFIARELALAIATEIHAPLNLQAQQFLRREMGQDDAAVERWNHRWMGKTLSAVEQRLHQLGARDFLFGAPGMFEAVLIPQLYNARRIAFDLEPMPLLRRIEAACLALPEFVRAHPDNQPDTPTS